MSPRAELKITKEGSKLCLSGEDVHGAVFKIPFDSDHELRAKLGELIIQIDLVKKDIPDAIRR